MTQISENTSVSDAHADGLVCQYLQAADDSEFSHSLRELRKKMERQSKVFLNVEDEIMPKTFHTPFTEPSPLPKPRGRSRLSMGQPITTLRPGREEVLSSLERVLSTLPTKDDFEETWSPTSVQEVKVTMVSQVHNSCDVIDMSGGGSSRPASRPSVGHQCRPKETMASPPPTCRSASLPPSSVADREQCRDSGREMTTQLCSQPRLPFRKGSNHEMNLCFSPSYTIPPADCETTKPPSDQVCEEPPPVFERSKTIVVIPAIIREKTFVRETEPVDSNDSSRPNTSLNLATPSVRGRLKKSSLMQTGSAVDITERNPPSVRGTPTQKQRARWVKPTAGGEDFRRSLPGARMTAQPPQKCTHKITTHPPLSRQTMTPRSSQPATPTVNSARNQKQVIHIPPIPSTPLTATATATATAPTADLERSATPTTPIQLPEIPEKALHQILSYLPSLAATRASQVCRTWRAACYHPSVGVPVGTQRRVWLDRDGTTSINVRLLGAARSAEELVINGRSDAERLLRAVNGLKLKPKHVRITNCSPGWAEPLVILLAKKDLQTIQVRNSGRPGAANAFWERIAMHCHQLDLFELPGNPADASVMCSRLLKIASGQKDPFIRSLHVQWEQQGNADHNVLNERAVDVAGVVRWFRGDDGGARLLAGRLNVQITLASRE